MSRALTLKVEDGLTIARRPSAPRELARNYAAAAPSRFVQEWSTEVLTSDDALEQKLRSLVARSREQRRNNDYVRHFDALARMNIVGQKGVTVRPRPMTKKKEIDEQAKAAVSEAWDRWARRENCDSSGRSSWVEMQNLAVSSAVQSGEFLARKIVGGEGGDFGFALQIFDPLALEPTYRRDLRGGGFIRLSIEFDSRGVIVAYHLRVRPGTIISNLQTSSFGGSRFVRIPAAEILHLFLTEEVGQKRGIPWVSTSLLRLKMLDAYQEAALVAARAGATKVAFITKPRGRGYKGPKDSDGFRTMNAEAGTIEELDQGSELLNWDPSYPHGEYDSFTKRTLQGIASGLLISYTTLANDVEGATFSSERGRKLTERDVWGSLQTWLVDHFNRPVFEDWLAFALARGQVASGGRVYRPSDFDRLVRVNYQPRTWSWAVNPLQEATAAKLEVDSGFRSRDDVILSQYGREPSEVDDEIAAFQNRAETKNLALSGPATIAISVSENEGTNDGS